MLLLLPRISVPAQTPHTRHSSPPLAATTNLAATANPPLAATAAAALQLAAAARPQQAQDGHSSRAATPQVGLATVHELYRHQAASSAAVGGFQLAGQPDNSGLLKSQQTVALWIMCVVCLLQVLAALDGGVRFLCRSTNSHCPAHMTALQRRCCCVYRPNLLGSTATQQAWYHGNLKPTASI